MNNSAVGMTMWGMVGSWMITTIIGGFPWIAFFMFTQFLGIRQYRTRDLVTAKRIQSRITLSSDGDEKDRRMGWSAGFWYVLNIHVHDSPQGERMEVWMIATTETYKRLTEQEIITVANNNSDKSFKQKEPITILQRTGNFYHMDFAERSMTIRFTPNDSQAAVIDKIKQRFQKTESCVVFLHGLPGTGKTMVGLLLADQLSGKICNTLRPWQPGETLAALHNEAAPTRERPLIVCMDEIDVALTAIHVGIEPHKNIPIPVKDKQGWNTLLDEINRGMYPWTILLLTSNRSPDFIRSLDPSFIRAGRVNITEELTEICITD
jgi:hypothetical protein